MQFLQIAVPGGGGEEVGQSGFFVGTHGGVPHLRRRIVVVAFCVVMTFRMSVSQVLVGAAHAVDELQDVNGFEALFFHGVAHIDAAGEERNLCDVSRSDVGLR